MTDQLVKDIFRAVFRDDSLDAEEDAALVYTSSRFMRMSTDTFVIHPLVFPGGDIGKLAVAGTVNDLAVCGAKPEYLSVGFVLEEGLEVSLLRRIVESMAETANIAGVRIVAGDTKVVEKGKGDGIFINTTGIGFEESPGRLHIRHIRPGDRVLINGGVGEHAVAVLGIRAGIQFSHALESDCFPLNKMIEEVLKRFDTVRFMRDPTRGGVATTLKEIAEMAKVNITIFEEQIPVKPEVKGALEILGMEPYYLANEGKVILIVAEHEADSIVSFLREFPGQEIACEIGYVAEGAGHVLLKTPFGGTRNLKRLAGTPLPRIC